MKGEKGEKGEGQIKRNDPLLTYDGNQELTPQRPARRGLGDKVSSYKGGEGGKDRVKERGGARAKRGCARATTKRRPSSRSDGHGSRDTGSSLLEVQYDEKQPGGVRRRKRGARESQLFTPLIQEVKGVGATLPSSVPSSHKASSPYYHVQPDQHTS